mmetsp:Transcript_25456/g.37539  ORF Transcript_25456/g.37539 Transcript_25456/m.37539 type:complete len:211 (-) Transcript_25456:214-846(-)
MLSARRSMSDVAAMSFDQINNYASSWAPRVQTNTPQYITDFPNITRNSGNSQRIQDTRHIGGARPRRERNNRFESTRATRDRNILSNASFDPSDYMLFPPGQDYVNPYATHPTPRQYGGDSSQGNNYEELLALDEQVVKRGLSAKRIAQLHYRRPTRPELLKDCSICRDRFQSDSSVCALPCRHVYHKDCILPWFESNRTCPSCRMELEK